jgi:hypothetical protein
VFLLGLEGGLRGIAIQVCAALAFYVGDNFDYFHRLYLAEVQKWRYFEFRNIPYIVFFKNPKSTN